MNSFFANLGERIRREKIISRIAEKQFHGDVYLVGGAIREIALGGSPKDYDFVINNEKDLRIFEAAFSASSFILGKKPIQTHRIVARDTSLDISFHLGLIEIDLSRRDFTVNAMAYDVKNGTIIDPLGGLADIERKIIRHTGEQVIGDDPLRMLKAVRHLATLNGFSLDANLEEAIRNSKELIHQSAPERIKYELDQIITSYKAFEGMKVMERTGLLFDLFPGLQRLRELDEEKGFVLTTYGHTIDGFKYLRKYGDTYDLNEKALRNVGYALLFHDLGKARTFSYDKDKMAVHFFYHERHSREIATSIMETLRFSSSEIKNVVALIESHMRIFLISGPEATERAVRRLVYKMEDLTPMLIVHSMCDMFGSSGGSENESTRQVEIKCGAILKMYYDWKKQPLPRLVSGDDLLSVGFRSGPYVGMVLADIREKQISGEIREKSEALQYALTFLRSPS
ncbi:MAG: HD domain-containing protein [Syntrophobacterales bacterium]|jgi:tRNA nucleotidyltransferase/poly(A) polymerase|nr:HD domain-containing protein [Syntrophobacterales bacterium]